jgi:hypothetical protein
LIELEAELRAEVGELMLLGEQADQGEYNFTDPESRITPAPTAGAV